MDHYPNLNPEKALIWRIVHRDNLPWILDNGLHCSNSAVQCDNWVNIGNEELIDRRNHRQVPVHPGGVLSDYVPFYFTPFSPMMYNIFTGRGGVMARPNEEIVILVSSMHKVLQGEHAFVFSDRHAYVATAQFYSQLSDLGVIDWPLLQTRNFQRSADDPDKIERYQAEALVAHDLPVAGLIGIVCYTDELKYEIESQVNDRGLGIDVRKMTGWYF